MAKSSTYSETQSVVTSKEKWNPRRCRWLPTRCLRRTTSWWVVTQGMQNGAGNVREGVEHTDEEGNIPLLQFVPLGWIILVAVGERYTDR